MYAGKSPENIIWNAYISFTGCHINKIRHYGHYNKTLAQHTISVKRIFWSHLLSKGMNITATVYKLNMQ